MNMPGFTAEASLFNNDMHYQATTKDTVYDGIVQPAISDFFDLYRPIFCLKLQCVYIDRNPYRICFQVAGIWNRVTRTCE